MRLIRFSSAALTVLAAAICGPAWALESEQAEELVQLEKKFFGHTFYSDPTELRTERLEQMIFGDKSTGACDGRIDKLFSAAKIETPTAQSQTTDASPNSTQASSTDTDTQSGADSTAEAIPDQDSYPRVTALENIILGQTHVGEPLDKRFSRMEEKAFGKIASNVDLGDRKDRLEDYAERKLHKKLDPPPMSEDVATDDHGNQSGRRAASGGSSQVASGIERQLINVAANALLGMTGVGRIGFGGIGPGFMPGMMPNGGVNSAGSGTNARHRNQQQTQAQDEPTADAPAKVEDPAIRAATPPPPDAKMMTKVGWCEMQLYGETHTELHLPERLVRLSRELHFEQGKSGVELMDHVNAMMKVVQSQKPAVPISSQNSNKAL